MKATVALVFAFACIFALYTEANASPSDMATKAKEVKEPKEIKESATASKDVKDAIKNAKDAKKNKKDCMKECGTNYDPICAHDPTNTNMKPRTFGTQCAMEIHNCEMASKLVMKNKGECVGADAVNLYVG